MTAAALWHLLADLPARALAFLVVVYQWTIRPLIGPNCRFTPTCSDYAITALRTHGALQGGYLGAKRILRCNPWHPGGHDPVPDAPCTCHPNFRKPAR